MPETHVIPADPQHAGRLGRSLVTYDQQSQLFPARSLVPRGLPLVTKTWGRPSAYDQGQTSQCVIYTGKGQINTSPFRTPWNYLKRRTYNCDKMYRIAQSMDEWPGSSYDGTSVLAGQKAMKSEGFIKEYRWCFGLDDVLQVLSHYGGVGIGITWYNSMFTTRPYGMLNVDTTSGIAGGHAVELHGINIGYKYVIGTNSWGTDWGYNGRFRIKWADLDKLLKDWGEAYAIVK